ncbi:MAG: hypothetical protein ACR2MB_09850 [Acidimicrobiales bacterium]
MWTVGGADERRAARRPPLRPSRGHRAHQATGPVRPGEDFRLQFGERLTVLAGPSTDERAELVEVLVEVMAGRLPNASLIYTDHAGRRVFADRTGATFADTGAPAPSLPTSWAPTLRSCLDS